MRTREGWCYLATVIDLASRRVAGFAVADPMRASLVCSALEMALGARQPATGLAFHSDRGSRYTSGTVPPAGYEATTPSAHNASAV